MPKSQCTSLSIGGATFDLFVTTDVATIEHAKQKVLHLPLGEKITASGVHGRSGGGACNTATGLARLGFDAGFCGVLGNDQWGQLLLEQLKKEGVRTDCLTVVENETSSFSLIFSAKDGERVIVYSAGANAHLRPTTLDTEAVSKAQVVYLNHLHHDSAAVEEDVIDTLIAHPAARLTWNPGGCQIQSGLRDPINLKLLARTDVLIVNKEEALLFTGASDDKAALRALLKTGAKIVCITDGKRGSVASDGEHAYHCPILPAPVVDTTGAGDAFGTALTWALATGQTLPIALIAGTINGASVVGAIGAQPGLLTDTQMHSALQSAAITVEETTI